MFWRLWESYRLFKFRRTWSVWYDLCYNISAPKGTVVELTKYLILLCIWVSFKNGTYLLKPYYLELYWILNSLLDKRFVCFWPPLLCIIRIGLFYEWILFTTVFFFWNLEVKSNTEWTGDRGIEAGISFAASLALASRIIAYSRFYDEHKVM